MTGIAYEVLRPMLSETYMFTVYVPISGANGFIENDPPEAELKVMKAGTDIADIATAAP